MMTPKIEFSKYSILTYFMLNLYSTRNTFCGTWYLPHSQVHNEQTVSIIMAVCIAHARNGRISTSGLKYDVTVVFLDPDFFKDAKIFRRFAYI